jgi:hypothetical protein
MCQFPSGPAGEKNLTPIPLHIWLNRLTQQIWHNRLTQQIWHNRLTQQIFP